MAKLTHFLFLWLVVSVGLFDRAVAADTLSAAAIGKIQLTKPFTLTYAVTRRNVASPALKEEMLTSLRANYDARVRGGSLTAGQRDALMKQASDEVNFRAGSGVVKISSDQKRILYLVQSQNNLAAGGALFDGKETLFITPESQFHQTIVSGLHRRGNLPTFIPAVATLYTPLMDKPLKIGVAAGSRQSFRGNVVLNGSVSVPGEIETAIDGGSPKVLTLLVHRTGDKGIFAKWSFLKHQRFEGVWIASRLTYTRYSPVGAPMEEYSLNLVRASTSADPSELQFERWIHDWAAVDASLGREHLYFQYRVGAGSWLSQAHSARLHPTQMISPPDADRLLGHMAPDFSCRDIDGKLESLHANRGKVVLIDFWATWCAPCRAEIPWQVRTYNAHHRQGFDILGFSSDDSVAGGAKETPPQIVKRFTQKHGMTWSQAFDPGQEIRRKYSSGSEGIPFTILIGRDGKVRAFNPAGKDLEAAVRAALSDR